MAFFTFISLHVFFFFETWEGTYLKLKKVSAIVLHKMADAQSSEASVPGEPEAVPTDEPNRESIVASL